MYKTAGQDVATLLDIAIGMKKVGWSLERPAIEGFYSNMRVTHRKELHNVIQTMSWVRLDDEKIKKFAGSGTCLNHYDGGVWDRASKVFSRADFIVNPNLLILIIAQRQGHDYSQGRLIAGDNEIIYNNRFSLNSAQITCDRVFQGVSHEFRINEHLGAEFDFPNIYLGDLRYKFCIGDWSERKILDLQKLLALTEKDKIKGSIKQGIEKHRNLIDSGESDSIIIVEYIFR